MPFWALSLKDFDSNHNFATLSYITKGYMNAYFN